MELAWEKPIMPLDTIGSYAASSSNGAITRLAARGYESAPAASKGSAGLSVRLGSTDIEETKVSSSGGIAVYVSPFIRFDIETRLAIVEIRNSQTGEVQQQYPSPRAVREYAQNLPEDSDLRSENSEQEREFAPHVIGGDTGSNADDAPAATLSQGATPGRSSAAVAFSSLQSAPAPTRELATA
jgi:hypothetical protein